MQMTALKKALNFGTKESDGSQEVAESALIPVLVKAIQEQQTTIEALTARIAALES